MDVIGYIEKILRNYKCYKDYWNYEDGCVLAGCVRLYHAAGEKRYIDFVINYLEKFILEDGKIINYDLEKYSVDSFNAGKCLFAAFDETNEQKYIRAAGFLIKILEKYPRTNAGNFIHKSIYPGQVWLDGLYMVQPFYAEYERRFDNGKNYSDIVSQFRNVRHLMYDREKQLYRHGYDSAKIQFWADKDTGLSENCWLRAEGWYLMGLVDTIEMFPDETVGYDELCLIFREAANGLIKYRDEDTGLFYQVVDRGNEPGNYLETSGSLMAAYAFMKAARLGISDSSFAKTGAEIFEAVLREKLRTENGETKLVDVCLSAGLGAGAERDGSAKYYFSEKRVADDPKGTGPLMMAFSERIRQGAYEKE